MLKSVGAMQNKEIKNNDGTIRDAAYLEAQLVDPSLQQSQVIKKIFLRVVFGNYDTKLSPFPFYFLFFLDSDHFLGSCYRRCPSPSGWVCHQTERLCCYKSGRTSQFESDWSNGCRGWFTF